MLLVDDTSVEPRMIVVPAVRGTEVARVDPPITLIDAEVGVAPLPDKLVVLLMDKPRVDVMPAVRGVEVEKVDPPTTSNVEDVTA